MEPGPPRHGANALPLGYCSGFENQYTPQLNNQNNQNETSKFFSIISQSGNKIIIWTRWSFKAISSPTSNSCNSIYLNCQIKSQIVCLNKAVLSDESTIKNFYKIIFLHYDYFLLIIAVSAILIIMITSVGSSLFAISTMPSLRKTEYMFPLMVVGRILSGFGDGPVRSKNIQIYGQSILLEGVSGVQELGTVFLAKQL